MPPDPTSEASTWMYREAAEAADVVVVVDKGRIVEEGTHDRLLSLRGTYFDLYSRQMLARELEEST